MNDSLFEIPESKSPRLIWIEKHGIRTSTHVIGGWAAWVSTKETKSEAIVAFAKTEDDAIFALAEKLQLRLWNEE